MTDEKLTDREGLITGMPRSISIWLKIAGGLGAALLVWGLFQIFVK